MEQTKEKKWHGVVGLAVIAVLLLSMCGESDSEKKAKLEAYKAMPITEKIKTMSGMLIEVDEVVKGEALMITFFKPSIWDGKNWTWNFLETAKTVLARMDEASQGIPYKRVTFMAQIPTRNNLGQEDRQLGMKVTYQLEKLAGAKWDKMTSFDVAELADDIDFRPLGTEAVLEYCKDGDHFKYTPKFCKRAVASGMKQYKY